MANKSLILVCLSFRNKKERKIYVGRIVMSIEIEDGKGLVYFASRAELRSPASDFIAFIWAAS